MSNSTATYTNGPQVENRLTNNFNSNSNWGVEILSAGSTIPDRLWKMGQKLTHQEWGLS
jgi:hypothetical protein